MIYLIGGIPRGGKTTTAKKLSKKMKIPWISTDTIESMILVNTKVKERERLFPKNVLRKKTKQSNDLMYAKYSAKQIRNAYVKQAKASFKSIEMLVECELKEGNDYIIEGHQLHPQLIDRIIKKYGKKNIQSLVITRFEIEGIVKGCLKNNAKSDWFIQKTKNKETFIKIAEMIREYSLFFEKESQKYGIQTVNMDKDFLKQIDSAVKLLDNK